MDNRINNSTNCTRIVGLFLLFLSISAISLETFSQDVRPCTNADKLLKVQAAFWDKEAADFLRDVNFSDVRIKVGKSDIPFKCFGRSDDPLAIGVLYDSSGSMSRGNTKVKTLIQGLKSFVKSGNESNTYFIAAFDTEVDEIVEKTSDQTKVVSSLESFASKETNGNTSVYDAIDHTILKLANFDHKHKVLIVISDGVDNASTVEFLELKDRVLRHGIQVFRIDYERISPSPRDYFGVSSSRNYVGLDRIADDSGGVTYALTKASDVLESFDLINRQLRSRYVIGFDFPVAPSSKLQKIDIKFKERTSKENVFVKSSSGFYF